MAQKAKKFFMLPQLVKYPLFYFIPMKMYPSKILRFFLLFSDQESIVRVPLKGDVLSVTKESFGLRRLFQRIFLPQGYPDSVSADYIHYQIWDTVQAFCSTITGNRNR